MTSIDLLRHVRNERQLPRARDRGLERALVLRARARNPARLDLAALGNEGRQQPDILVIDVINLVRAELADAAPTEEPAAARTVALPLVLVVLLAAAAAATRAFSAHR